MTDMLERLSRLRVTAKSPDGRIVGEVLRGRETRLAFVGDAYRWYSELTLSGQLESLAKLMWAGNMRAQYVILSELHHETIRDEGDPKDDHKRRYRAERDALAVQAESADGALHITTTGMREWRVTIRPGTLKRLSARDFLEELNLAAEAIVAEHGEKVAALKTKYYPWNIGDWT